MHATTPHEPAIELLPRAGGRMLAVYTLAQGGAGRTVVLCHAAPGSAAFDPDPAQTQARGIRLLALDRPGYGRSDPLPAAEWLSVAAAADDVAAALDQAGVKQAGVAGWSAGGRVALALAARRPDLVDRVVVLATPAPNEQVPWVPPEQAAALEQLRGQPADRAQAALAEQLALLLPPEAGDADLLGLLGSSEADAPALELPGARERLLGMLRAAFAQGMAGLAADIAGYCLQPWGFAPEGVQAKTLLLYGSADPVAGARHGSWWQKRLPNARLEMVPGAGHLLVVPMWQRALAHLAPNAMRSR